MQPYWTDRQETTEFADVSEEGAEDEVRQRQIIQMRKQLTHVSGHQTQTWRLVLVTRQLSQQPMCLDSDTKQPRYAKHLD